MGLVTYTFYPVKQQYYAKLSSGDYNVSNMKTLKYTGDSSTGFNRIDNGYDYSYGYVSSGFYCSRFDFSKSVSKGYSLNDLLIMINTSSATISSISFNGKMRMRYYSQPQTFRFGQCAGAITSETGKECTLNSNKKDVTIQGVSNPQSFTIDVGSWGIPESFAYALGGSVTSSTARFGSVYDVSLTVTINNPVERISQEYIELTFPYSSSSTYRASNSIAASNLIKLKTDTSYSNGFASYSGDYKIGTNNNINYCTVFDFSGSKCTYEGVDIPIESILINNKESIYDIELHLRSHTLYSDRRMSFHYGPYNNESTLLSGRYYHREESNVSSYVCDATFPMSEFVLNGKLKFVISGNNYQCGKYDLDPNNYSNIFDSLSRCELKIKVYKVKLNSYVFNNTSQLKDSSVGTITSGELSESDISLIGIPGQSINVACIPSESGLQYTYTFNSWDTTNNNLRIPSPKSSSNNIEIPAYDSVLRAKVNKLLNSYECSAIISTDNAGELIAPSEKMNYGDSFVIKFKPLPKYRLINFELTQLTSGGQTTFVPAKDSSGEYITDDDGYYYGTLTCKGACVLSCVVELGFNGNTGTLIELNGDTKIRRRCYFYVIKEEDEGKVFYPARFYKCAVNSSGNKVMLEGTEFSNN